MLLLLLIVVIILVVFFLLLSLSFIYVFNILKWGSNQKQKITDSILLYCLLWLIEMNTQFSRNYENMPIQIYWKFHHQNTQDFSDKNSDIFHISAQNIDCGYSLEPPRRGGSNEIRNLCFEQK